MTASSPTMIHMQAVRYVDHQVRKRRSFIIRSYKALYLLKGLIVALLLVSVNLHALLQAVTSSFNEPDGFEVAVCVRKGIDQCQFYPCEERGEVIKEITSPKPVFGYAGSFVRRVENITKPIPESLGDTGWASGCILSDEYKFVFIHVLKSGGTAVKQFIKDSLCGPDDNDCSRAPTSLVRAEGCIKSIRDHQDYFHFSFVRNPYARIFSAYSMMDGFPPVNGLRGRLPTQDYTFSDFVLRPNERGLHTSMWLDHTASQESFLFSDQEKCPMFDFLGRIEHFDEDMRRVLAYLNATKILDYLESNGGRVSPANSWGADKKKSMVDGLREEYSSHEVIARVASDYKSDFQLLGYDPSVIPIK